MYFKAFPIFLLSAILLSACAGWNPADEQSSGNSSYQKTPDGYYRVRKGDTLHAIAFKFGLDWKNIAGWNGIRAPYTIYPDQELRLAAPSGYSRQQTQSGSTSTVVKAAPSKGSSSKTAEYKPATTVKPAASTTTTATTSTAAPKPAPKPVVKNANPGKWLWPVEGRVVSNFKPNDPARKGIDIGGKEGQSVVASASGEVVYSGSGLIGYGELIIIKHNEQLLSAYAHNRKRLVKEGQNVSGGDHIAEMGKNDRSQAMLHFEIRLDGTPQDPLKYLPSR
jgi:lipoprotein NlpD